jgi:hypothetical protein
MVCGTFYVTRSDHLNHLVVLEGDTEELPGIIEETEQSLRNMEEIRYISRYHFIWLTSPSQKLKQAKDNCESHLTYQKGALSKLEALEVEMTELVERHQSVEVRMPLFSHSRLSLMMPRSKPRPFMRLYNTI